MNSFSRKLTVSVNTIFDMCLLMFFCAWNVHVQSSSFDILLRYGSATLCFVITMCSAIKSGSLKNDSYFIWLSVFLIYYNISKFWSHSYEDSRLRDSTFFCIWLITFCIIQRVKNLDDLNKIIRLFVISIVYMCLFLFIVSPISDWVTGQIGTSVGLWKNDVGERSAYGCIMGIYLFFNRSNFGEKVLLIFEIVILSVVCLLSGSRTALLIIPATFIVALFMFYKARKISVKRIRNLFLWVIAIVLIVYFAYRLIINNSTLYHVIGIRIEKLINVIFYGSIGDGSIIERQFYLKAANQLFLDNIFWGYGANGFYTYMREISYSHIAYCHNNFFEILSTLGLVGFAIYYYMPTKVTLNSYLKKQHSIDRSMALIWSFYLIFIVSGLVDVYLYDVISNIMILLISLFLNIKSKQLNKLYV